MELSNPFNPLQTYEETAIVNSETSMTLYQAPATPKGRKRRALSSPKKMLTPTPINTPKSMLLKAKALIERAMKEETDHANKVNLESAILDLQIALGQKSSPEVQIEDLSEEEQFLRKKVMQKSTKPVHQTKDQKLSLVKNLLQEICKDKNEETDQLQIEILLQMVEKAQKNQPIGKVQEKSESGQDTNIQIALLQKQVTDIKANMAKKMNQVLEVISQKKTPTYAEIASKNLPIPQVVITKKPASQLTSQAGNPTTVQKKPAEKRREKSAYRERRQ